MDPGTARTRHIVDTAALGSRGSCAPQAAMHGLIKFVHEEMAAYRLYTVVPRLVAFIEQLTNWCVGRLALRVRVRRRACASV